MRCSRATARPRTSRPTSPTWPAGGGPAWSRRRPAAGRRRGGRPLRKKRGKRRKGRRVEGRPHTFLRFFRFLRRAGEGARMILSVGKKYRGKALADVPLGYLLWLVEES